MHSDNVRVVYDPDRFQVVDVQCFIDCEVEKPENSIQAEQERARLAVSFFVLKLNQSEK